MRWIGAPGVHTAGDGVSREYFIDRYVTHAVPSSFELKLVPTYRCNLACSYCYTNTFRRRYPGEMSWDVFARVIDRFAAEDGKIVRILGGEPCLWVEIDRAIAHLRSAGMRSIVLSNGTSALGELPDEIHVNIEHYYESDARERVLTTLASYRERGPVVRFRYNVQPDDPARKLDQMLQLAARFGARSFHLGTAWPW